jgi:hypothetical protein
VRVWPRRDQGSPPQSQVSPHRLFWTDEVNTSPEFLLVLFSLHAFVMVSCSTMFLIHFLLLMDYIVGIYRLMQVFSHPVAYLLCLILNYTKLTRGS